MIATRRDLLKAVGTLTLTVALPAWVYAKDEDPFQWVLQMSNQVLDRIKSDESLKKGELKAINKLVDEVVLPNVDFTMMTRMTVGPKWRQATPEQRQALQDNFRELLIRVYSGALSKVGDHTAELLPTRNNKVQDEMVIRTQLKSATQNPIGMDYRIYRNKLGDWKIVDVNVEGVWMVENYRSQFSSTLNQEGIDGLIRELKARVENSGK